MVEIDEKLILEKVKEVIKNKKLLKEISITDLKGYVDEFLIAGANGSISGKPWSLNYQRNQEYYLNKFFKECQEKSITEPLRELSLRTIILNNTRSYSEKKGRYAAVIAFVKFLNQLELISDQRLESLKKIKPIRSKPPEKKYISEKQFEEILSSVKRCPFTKEYDKNLLNTVLKSLYLLGIRINELCNINISDIDFEKQELFIPEPKGLRSFTRGFSLELKNLWLEYKDIRPQNSELKFFLNKDGSPVKRDSLIQRFRRVTRKLGINTSFHALRRNYITRQLEDGKSLLEVSLAVNHSSPLMTEKYIVPDKKKAIESQKFWS